jgi:hypothetical protein
MDGPWTLVAGSALAVAAALGRGAGGEARAGAWLEVAAISYIVWRAVV